MAWSSERPAQFRSVFQRHCIFLFAFLSLWGKMDCLSLRVKRDERLYHYSRAVLFLSVCRNTVYARLHYSSSKSQAFLPQFLLLLSTDHFRRVRRSAPSTLCGGGVLGLPKQTAWHVYMYASEQQSQRKRRNIIQ